MSQDTKNIAVKDLVIWTENPRDPIDSGASDQDIADRAIKSDSRKKWSLKKLFEKMGKRFDQSEIPTVAYLNGRPIVYDGNRRVLIGKIMRGYVKLESDSAKLKSVPGFSDFEFPETIPCNVCDKKTALEHVDRKHSDSGSWSPLERDIFKHKFMKEKKSSFLILEEKTNIISQYPELNKRFVKEEVFDSRTLHKIGFSTNGDKLKHAFPEQSDANAVLEKIAYLVINGEISTRENRGEIEKLLSQDERINNIFKKKKKTYSEYDSSQNLSEYDSSQNLSEYDSSQNLKESKRKTRISKGKGHDLFGEKLFLETGPANNLYTDLLIVYQNRKKYLYSEDLHMLIRMGMRLLCESAFNKNGKGWEIHLRGNNFQSAKEQLSPDEKTTLNSQLVNEGTIVKLLQTGAHDYTSSNNFEQTIAISLIVGKLLQSHCPKKP